MNSRRIGKVARLPEDIRNQVNEMIADGVEYSHIIDHLTQLGHPGFSPRNISNWKDGGFEDWLRHRERVDELELKVAYAVEMANGADAGKFRQAALNLTAIQFFQLLNRFDPNTLSRNLEAHPEKFPAVINSFATLMREVVGLERFRAEQEERQRRLADLNPADQGGITTPTLMKMLAALRLRYPREYELAAQTQPAPEPEPERAATTPQ